jgi:uncharacterized membrane protein
MPAILKVTRVNAPIEMVFGAFDVPEALPQYDPHVTKVSAVRRSARRIGDTFQATYVALGVPFEEQFTYTEYIRPTKVVARFEGLMTGIMRTTLTPQDGATTHVALEIHYQVPGGVVGKVVDALLVERMQEKNAERMLENIKRIVERRASTLPAQGG